MLWGGREARTTEHVRAFSVQPLDSALLSSPKSPLGRAHIVTPGPGVWEPPRAQTTHPSDALPSGIPGVSTVSRSHGRDSGRPCPSQAIPQRSQSLPVRCGRVQTGSPRDSHNPTALGPDGLGGRRPRGAAGRSPTFPGLFMSHAGIPHTAARPYEVPGTRAPRRRVRASAHPHGTRRQLNRGSRPGLQGARPPQGYFRERGRGGGSQGK